MAVANGAACMQRTIRKWVAECSEMQYLLVSGRGGETGAIDMRWK